MKKGFVFLAVIAVLVFSGCGGSDGGGVTPQTERLRITNSCS